jgi:hypothetical protein
MSSTLNINMPPSANDDSLYAEKRRSPRVYCRVPVTLRTAEGNYVAATCLDVNYNGVGIETDGDLKVGQRLQLLARRNDGGLTPVPMLVIFRMQKHYGLSALDAWEDVLKQIPYQQI